MQNYSFNACGRTFSLFSLVLVSLLNISFSHAEEVKIKVNKNYLNFPVSHRVDRQKMIMKAGKDVVREFDIRLAEGEPDYWVFADISMYKGKTITLEWPSQNSGLHKIYQDDQIAGQDSLYKEKNRPQLHFSTRRGWINDPNGLIFYEGEYHLFYQHNPYERHWGNMHWGHAVSKDLIHWEELPVALYPDHNGTIFSGTAVIDYENTAGFNKKDTPAMIAYYTADTHEKQTQCFAYSLDKGRTWTKYANNPVLDTKHIWNSKDTRDPKVFRYEPNNEWVMVLNERDGHSIFTSADLKDWTFRSHITGFWECPELFELPVDGDPNNTRWVMYGASGTYMIGDFNGYEFTPEAGKYYYTTGGLYAAQTVNNMPASDNRRVQIAWGRLRTPDGTPFNKIMLLPTEMTLRTTKDGIRLFSYPIDELKQLEQKKEKWSNLSTSEAREKLQPYKKNDRLHIRATLHMVDATWGGLRLNDTRLFNYDMNSNTVNDVFYSPEDPTSMDITFDLFIDKYFVEFFVDGGAYSNSFLINENIFQGDKGFEFHGNMRIKELEVSVLDSIW